MPFGKPGFMDSRPLRFQDFALSSSLQKALAKMNFREPTPIQQKTLIPALAGRDIVGCAQTGTGKTAAFVIPLIARLQADPDRIALILTPTRELAMQISDVVRHLTWFEKDWNYALLIGGSPYGGQLQALRKNPRFVIGTPGRVQDHLDQGSLQLERTGALVLDEADRMLDMGFAPQIESILKSVPTDRQTFLFTATLPAEIEKIAKRFLKTPERIVVGPNSKPVEAVRQKVVETNEGRKLEDFFEHLYKLKGSVLIFTKTRHRTERLTEAIAEAGFDVTSIHGERTQRQRLDAIRDFKKGQARVLVATDVAARGLDVPHIAHVINFDLPQEPEDYVHRIGRTARNGAEGDALTFVTPQDRDMWRRIESLIHGKRQGTGTAGRGERSARGFRKFSPGR